MPNKTKGRTSEPQQGSLAAKLAALTGGSSSLDIDGLDGTILWLAVNSLARHQASISIGVTKDGGSWAIQLWDGQFPVKDYYRDTDALNKALAALVRVYEGNNVSPEVEQLLQSYGW